MADDDRRSVGVRVRPNSHDFVRQLRQDLATKKVTYTVDVKANTNPATRDVRDWARNQLQKIYAAVPVQANTGTASRDMAEWRRRQAGIKTTVNVSADMSAANRDVDVWRKYAGRDLEIRVKADVSGRGVETMRRAMAKDAKIDVRADTSKARRQIAEVVEQPGLFSIEPDVKTKKAKTKLTEFFDEVQGTQAELDLGIDVEKARAKVEEFRRSQGGRKVQSDLDIDTKKARLKLLEMRIAEKAKKLEVNVDVKTSKFESFVDRLRSIEKQTGSFTLIRSLDAGPLNLGKPTGLIGTLTTITALAGALPGAVTGISALSDAFMRLGGIASILPGAIGAIAASMATLTIGTQGVGDTFSAMFDMWNEGSSQQAKSTTRMVAAQNNYRDAVVDEGKAQERVADARRQALGELRSLNNELRGGVLNEAQAMLDLQKARDRYAQGGFDNETDRLQAQLDIAKAEQNIRNTREDNLNLQQKANDANVKGVEGSDAVRDALDGQRRAAEATTQALEALSAGGAGATTATQKFNDMLSQLSPNARDFVTTIAGMKDEMFGFRNTIQDIMFQGAGPAFANMFDNLLPVVKPGMERIATGLNTMMLEVFNTVQGPQGTSIIDRILGSTADTQDALTKVINPLITGVGTLVAAGSEHLPQVVNLFNQLATRFSNFIQEADRNGTLDKFMNEGIDALGNLAETGINLVKIINDFSTAFKGAFNEDIFTMIARITGQWHDFLSSAEGQKKINDYINQAKDIWNEWKPVLEDLPSLIGNVSDAAQRVLKILLPILNSVTSVLERAPGLVEVFAGVWLTAKMASAVTTIVGLGKTFGTMLGSVRSLAGLVTRLLPNLGVVASYADKMNPGGATPAAATGTGALATAGTALGAVAVPAAIGGFVANQAADAGVGGMGQFAAGGAAAGLAYTPGVAVLPLLMSDPKFASKWFGDAGQNARQQLLDAIWKRFEDGGKKPEDAVKLYGDGATANMSREDLETLARVKANMPSFAFGGYTDWGIKSGRTAELHGGEYVQPHPTVAHYGVDAMKAVHEKRAVIGYEQGGNVPMAYPGNPVVPFGPGIGGGLGSYTPYMPGWLPGGMGKGMGGMTLWEWLKKHPRGGYEQGGLVYDPNTGQYVQEGAAISHGQNPGAAGPGVIDTIAQGTSSGLGSMGDSFLSGLGLGDLTGTSSSSTTSPGPGWGPDGPPIGLGGGPDGFDIRKFGIGPGPAGSGPNDWMNFTGKTLGSFAGSAVGAFSQGLLGAFGMEGILNSPYFAGATGLLGHFLNPDKDGKAQGAGAAETNAGVNDLLNTYAGMPDNPAYPGVPGLPGVFDPATGTALTPGVGEPYGIAPGANSGGYGNDDGKTFPAWVYQLGAAFGVKPSTYSGHQESDRKEAGYAPNPQHLNRGIDWSGKPEDMQRFADYLKTVPGMEQVIWNGAGVGTGDTVEIAGGRAQPGYFAGDLAGHGNHVHTRQSTPIPLPVALPNGQIVPGNPQMLSQPGVRSGVNAAYAPPAGRVDQAGSIKDLAKKVYAFSGFPPNEWSDFEWLIQKESSWNPAARNSSNHFGLIQFSEENRKAYGIGDTTDPAKQLAASVRYIKERYHGSPAEAHRFHNANGWFDRGGWLMPGQTTVTNNTGHPELLVPHDQLPSFAAGGYFPQGAAIPKPPPRPPDAIKMQPKPLPMVPKPTVPAITPTAPPVVAPPHVGTGAPPGPQNPPAPQGPGGGAINLGPVRPATGAGPGAESGIHTHPAVSKGITSGFAAAGNIAGAAASMGMGMGGGGALGGFVQGLFGQAGKIANNVANVAASFLVGNITGGTTENPYGVTQRGNVPTGGTKVVDASNNQYGDVYTNNLDEYFKTVDRRNAQKAQSGLGRWGSA